MKGGTVVERQFLLHSLTVFVVHCAIKPSFVAVLYYKIKSECRYGMYGRLLVQELQTLHSRFIENCIYMETDVNMKKVWTEALYSDKHSRVLSMKSWHFLL